MKKIVSVLGICAALGLAACEKPEEVVAVTAANGDTVVINFEGFMDGVQFPGGTAENFSLTLGSGQFIPGFEDQVVGMVEGEERDVNVSFPENYGVADLAGKPAVFKVKVLDIVGK